MSLILISEFDVKGGEVGKGGIDLGEVEGWLLG
jgi:hypothetical protein